MSTTKEKIDEIRRIVPGSPDVSLVTQGDKFVARLEQGPDGNAMAAEGSNFDEALDGILDRLRGASNVSAQDQAELNLAKTEANTAAQLGRVSPFHQAILAGKSVEEARAIANPPPGSGIAPGPDSDRDPDA